MRRRVLATAAAAALGVLAAVSIPPQGHAMVAKGSSRVQVGAFEFRFQLSRLRVKAGRVTVQLVNYGEDDHDLRFRRVGGTHLFKLPLTHPGEASQLTAKLRAGTFNLWCSLPGHKAAGMHAKLRVVRP